MKLLKKSTIQKDIAEQKRQQIDEGLTIARKVDALRLTLANLEGQHAKFIEGMKAELERQTGQLSKDVDNKRQEVAYLEAERLELIKPLTAEWEEVAKKSAEIEQIKSDLLVVSAETLKKEKVLENKTRLESEALNRIKVRERELIRVYDGVAQNLQDTERIKQETITEKNRWDKYYDIKNAEFAEREKGITSYLFTLDKRKEQIEVEEKEIVNEKLRLKDQRETLERTLARINKQ
jgi:hypothetical protein